MILLISVILFLIPFKSLFADLNPAKLPLLNILLNLELTESKSDFNLGILVSNPESLAFFKLSAICASLCANAILSCFFLYSCCANSILFLCSAVKFLSISNKAFSICCLYCSFVKLEPVLEVLLGE